jgi:hypothetical protein
MKVLCLMSFMLLASLMSAQRPVYHGGERFLSKDLSLPVIFPEGEFPGDVKPVGDAKQCLTDVAMATAAVAKAVGGVGFLSVMEAIRELGAVIKDCAGLFLNFSDDCKADWRAVKYNMAEISQHLIPFDMDSLKGDMAMVKSALSKMTKDCMPMPKELQSQILTLVDQLDMVGA